MNTQYDSSRTSFLYKHLNSVHHCFQHKEKIEASFRDLDINIQKGKFSKNNFFIRTNIQIDTFFLCLFFALNQYIHTNLPPKHELTNNYQDKSHVALEEK